MKPAAAALAAVAVYLVIAEPFVSAPLRWDETEFARQAEAIAAHGVPRIGFPESAYVTAPDSRLRTFDADYGLWHPPLYLYLLALPLLAGMGGEEAFRAVGLLLGAAGVALTAVLAARLARRSGLDGQRAAFAAAFAAGAVATSPFWVAGTLRIDIDGGLVSLIALAAAGAFALLRDRGPRARSLIAGTTCFVLLWAKLPSAALVLAGLVVFAFAHRAREALDVVRGAVAGAALFVGAWLAYTLLLDLPWNFPVVYTLRKEETAIGLFDVANSVRFNVAWIGLPLVCLGVLTAIAAGRRLRRRSPAPADALVTTAIVVALFYLLAWPEPGKYTVVLVPLVAVSSAIELARLAPRLARVNRFAVAAGAAAVSLLLLLLVYAFVVGDVLTAPAERHAGSRAEAVAADPRLPRLLAAVGVLGVAIVVARVAFRRRWTPALALAAAVTLLPAQVALAARLGDRARTTLVLAPKQESGFTETVAWLRREVRPDDVLAAPKDVGYYVDDARTIPIDRASSFPIEDVARAIAEGRPRFVAAERTSIAFIDFVAPSWRGGYALRERFGSFEVYERRAG